MKTIITKAICALLIGTATIACEGQNFINLDFESANVSPLAPGQFEIISPANAFPGWQVYWGSQPAPTVTHNTFSVGSVDTSILGPVYNGAGILEGNYSAMLVAGLLFGSGPTNATLAQAGQVPLSAQSLQFKVGAGSVNFSALLGGQNLGLVRLGGTAAYDLYGANIPGFGGQIKELRITSLTMPGHQYNPIFLDSIEFSPNAVPEPGVWALLTLGGALLWCGVQRCRTAHRKALGRSGVTGGTE